MSRDAPRILLLIAATYLLVGTIGHDPWRGDDARHFGLVFEMIDTGPSLLPALDGDPSVGFGPLFYWLAAALATALQWLLPLHDGARLTTALLAAAALWALSRASRLMHGDQARTAVVLLTVGSLGLVVHVHETQPAIGLLAAQACTVWMLVSPHRLAMPAAGAAAGAAFLFAGVAGALVTWPLLLFQFLPSDRSERASPLAILGALALAVAIAFAWILPAMSEPGWPLWLDAEREALRPATPAADKVIDWFKLFGWFVWPLWPLALWSLWRAWHGAPIRHVPLLLVALVLALATVALSGSLRPANMLPLTVPLALLAAPAVERLRRGAAAAFDWFAVMTFSAFGLLLWLAWSALVNAWPPGLARHFKKLAPGFDLSLGVLALAVAAAVVVAWIAYLAWRRSGGRDATLTWALGMTLLWSLTTAMGQPWFDHSRSYRPAARQLAEVLRTHPGACVDGLGLGFSQRSAMHYFAGVRVRSESDARDCPLILVFQDRRSATVDLATLGREVWRFERGGGRQHERFTLLEAPAAKLSRAAENCPGNGPIRQSTRRCPPALRGAPS
ncbi:MAG: hypothetical protein KDG52_19425 [Rhodocyclaceae bacterium]|nr:hypothetical protein [Rhodocyclaceae bacterium]